MSRNICNTNFIYKNDLVMNIYICNMYVYILYLYSTTLINESGLTLFLRVSAPTINWLI